MKLIVNLATVLLVALIVVLLLRSSGVSVSIAGFLFGSLYSLASCTLYLVLVRGLLVPSSTSKLRMLIALTLKIFLLMSFVVVLASKDRLYVSFSLMGFGIFIPAAFLNLKLEKNK